MKKNNAIEVIRITAAAFIVGIHLNEFFGQGVAHASNFLSIYVELFFLMSGFFLMQHLDSKPNELETVWGYSIHKISGFFAPLCMVNFIHLYINCRMNGIDSMAGVFETIWHFKWELVLLQCAGFIPNPVTHLDFLVGPAWYLSAMVIATLFVYPLAKYYRKAFINVICPVAILFVYVSFLQLKGHMNVIDGFHFNFMDAIPRAFAALCVGALCYQAYSYLSKRDKKPGAGFVLLDTVSWMMIPISILFALYGKDDSGLFMLVPFSVIIISSMLGVTPIAKALCSIPSGLASFLGKFSLYVYLTHWTAIFAVRHYIPDADNMTKILASLGITMVYATIVYIIDRNRKSIWPVCVVCVAAVAAMVAAAVCGWA